MYSSKRLLAAAAVTVAVLSTSTAPAAATWSIIAVDEATGDVGAAMAACSPISALGEPDEVPITLVLVPGRGVAVAQGSVEPADLPQLRETMMDPALVEPSEVISVVVADNDPDLQATRQYAVITDDGAAAVSGPDAQPTSLALAGIDVAAQGVATTSEAVVEDSLEAFTEARLAGASLAEALAVGLEAGSRAGGDRSCGEQTALFAHVAVAGAGEDGITPSRILTVTVDEDDGQNPVSLLLDAQREGRTGWIDAGLNPPTTVPRALILAIGIVMAAAAILTIRRGMGYRLPRLR